MFCAKCGNDNPNGAKFCRVCGTPLQGNSPQMIPRQRMERTAEPGKPQNEVRGNAPNRNSHNTRIDADQEFSSVRNEQKEFDYFAYIFQSGHIRVTRRDVTITCPNEPVLGIIPKGKTSLTLPIRNINNIQMYSSISWGDIIFGILLFVLGWYLMAYTETNSRYFSILFFVIGIIKIVFCIKGELRISNNSSVYVLPFIPFEKKKFQMIQQAINTALDYEADKTDLGANLAEHLLRR